MCAGQTAAAPLPTFSHLLPGTTYLHAMQLPPLDDQAHYASSGHPGVVDTPWNLFTGSGHTLELIHTSLWGVSSSNGVVQTSQRLGCWLALTHSQNAAHCFVKHQHDGSTVLQGSNSLLVGHESDHPMTSHHIIPNTVTHWDNHTSSPTVHRTAIESHSFSQTTTPML